MIKSDRLEFRPPVGRLSNPDNKERQLAMSDSKTEENEQPKRKAGATIVPIRGGTVLQNEARQAMARTELSLRGLAKQLELPLRALSRWLEHEPTPHTKKIERGIREWLRKLAGGGHEPFVETASAERILSTLAYAQAYGDLVTIFGGPGVGKTRTIAHYRKQYDHVWVATMGPSCSALVPALEEICESVGLQNLSGGARRLARAIRSKVMGVKGLIIIDEAQHLNQAAIEELRSLHDWCTETEAPVAIALVGNETVYARLTGGSRAAHFAQLYSRIGMQLYLKRPTPRDVRAIAGRYGVDDKGLELLERVALKPGALRGVVKVCRLAQSAGSAVNHTTLRAAIDNLGLEV